jgi:hypothetical protein
MPTHGLIVVISGEPSDWGKVHEAHKALEDAFNASWSSWKLLPAEPDNNPSTADIVFAAGPDDGGFDELINGAVAAGREILVAGHPGDLLRFNVKPGWLLTEFHHIKNIHKIWTHLSEIVSFICKQSPDQVVVQNHLEELRLLLAQRRARFARAAVTLLLALWRFLIVGAFPDGFGSTNLTDSIRELIKLGARPEVDSKDLANMCRRITAGSYDDLVTLRNTLLGQENDTGWIANLR